MLIILALVFSCKSDISRGFTTIFINPESSDSLINKVFESVHLKTISDRQLLKFNVTQTRISENKLFVLTEDIKNHNCKLLIYKWPELTFIDSIVSGIDGPYNIKYIKCFDILKQAIYIVDALNGFLHVYSIDGKFIKKYNLNTREPFIFTHFIMINDFELILDSDNAPNIDKCRLKYYNLKSTNSKILYYNSKMPGGMSWERFDRDQNEIYFFTNLDPYIYRYNKNKIEFEKYIYLDFEGKYLLEKDLPPEIINNPTIINDIIDKDNKIYSIFSFYKFYNDICFTFYYKNKFIISKVNLNTSKVDIFKRKAKNVSNFIEPTSYPVAKDGKGKKIIFLEESENINLQHSDDLKKYDLNGFNLGNSDIFMIYQLSND